VEVWQFKGSSWLSDKSFLRVIDAHAGIIKRFNKNIDFLYFAIGIEKNRECEITPFIGFDLTGHSPLVRINKLKRAYCCYNG
jgi:hypothetical protein